MSGHALPALDVPLDRDRFVRTLIGHLAAALQDVVGLDEASGLVSIVGQKLGQEIDSAYRRELRPPDGRLGREQVAAVLVDLKRRIEGEFYVIDESDDRIVLGNRRCPFGEKVIGRPALCMMTSNVFGLIAAENLGYARVTIERAIARGDAECRVTVHLRAAEAGAEGREYFRGTL